MTRPKLSPAYDSLQLPGGAWEQAGQEAAEHHVGALRRQFAGIAIVSQTTLLGPEATKADGVAERLAALGHFERFDFAFGNLVHLQPIVAGHAQDMLGGSRRPDLRRSAETIGHKLATIYAANSRVVDHPFRPTLLSTEVIYRAAERAGEQGADTLVVVAHPTDLLQAHRAGVLRIDARPDGYGAVYLPSQADLQSWDMVVPGDRPSSQRKAA